MLRINYQTMSQSDIDALANELCSAYEMGKMIEVPPSARPGFNLDVAYEVEAKLKQRHEAGGYRSIGRKVGYANKAMWRVLKLETLVWAHMYEDTVHYSVGNDAALSIAHPRSLKIEPEIVFGMKQALTGQRLDAAGALAHVDWLAIGFEIIDCPFPDWKFQPGDFVASFGLHAGLVVGEKLRVQSDLIPKLVEDLAKFKVRMSKNGEFVEESAGKNSLKSPALCLAELDAAIERRSPAHLLGAGEIVSSGTLTAGHPTQAGDLWRVDVEGLPLPSLTLRLS